MNRINVPVLIVGGGVTGLTCSMVLSRLGIQTLLVNYYPTTSPHPKAHIINQRTMEIFDELGVAETIYSASTPPELMKYAAWYAGLKNGKSPYHGREIGRVEAWGCGWTDPDYIAASAYPHANFPQMYLEPILKAQAEALAPEGVLYFHELIDFEQCDQTIVATIKNRKTQECFEVECDFLLGADGGKTVGKKLGIDMPSQGAEMRMSSVHFAADISEWSGGKDVQTRFLINPDFGGSWASGVLMPEGPTQWGKHSEEWVYHARYTLSDTDPMDHDFVLNHMLRVFGIPDFKPNVINISEWRMGGFLADSYGNDRILLLGDSCRQHPPTGGLGLNGGVQDAYNLCWKIAFVLRGQAGLSLLKTYEQERRPVAKRHVELAMANAAHHFLIDDAIGLNPKDSPEQNWVRLKQIWSDSPATEPLRKKVSDAIAQQRIGFRHHNVEMGYTYLEGAILTDSTTSPLPPAQDPILIYEPSTRPGHPVPHALLQHIHKKVPIGNLVKDGNFVLVAGENGEAWVEAARHIAREHNLPLKAYRVGLNDGDYIDTRGAWQRQREISENGALLIRPDRFVAWRHVGAHSNPLKELCTVLSSLLHATITFPHSEKELV